MNATAAVLVDNTCEFASFEDEAFDMFIRKGSTHSGAEVFPGLGLLLDFQGGFFVFEIIWAALFNFACGPGRKRTGAQGGSLGSPGASSIAVQIEYPERLPTRLSPWLSGLLAF